MSHSQKNVLILLALLAIYGYFFLWDDEASKPQVELEEIEWQREPEEDLEEQEPPRLVQQKPSLPRKKPSPPPPRPKSPPKPKNPYKEKRDSIWAEIIGEYVVAQKDILLGRIEKGQSVPPGGNFKPQRPRLWDSAKIPYHINENVKNQQRIKQAIAYYTANTPIRLVPFQGEDNAIVFTRIENFPCSSYLGQVGGNQPIFLDDVCPTQSVIHEIGHALGLVHEHSRTDRDNYLEVVWDNIPQEMWPQFQILPDELIHQYTGSVFDFDFQSAMLYPPNAFAKSPGLVTLKVKGNRDLEPTNNGLSRIDRERIYYLYGK